MGPVGGQRGRGRQRRRGDAPGAVELGEHPVLVDGQVLDDLLGRVDLVAHGDEPHHVSRDAARQRDQVLLRPVLQRDAPGQRQQPGVGSGR